MNSVSFRIPVGGRWYRFETPAPAAGGYDVSADDELVLTEIFIENVYQVEAGHLVDTGLVIDIGGNIGAFDVYVAALGAKSVHTFEPDPENYALLCANIGANKLADVVHPHPQAVLGEAGSARIAKAHGASHIVGPKAGGMEADTVEAVSLAEAFQIAGMPNCDVLKMDCEGSEYGIIDGAPSDVLAKARLITMEFHSTDAVTFGRMVAKLTLTHNVHIVGKYTGGGQIYARLF